MWDHKHKIKQMFVTLDSNLGTPFQNLMQQCSEKKLRIQRQNYTVHETICALYAKTGAVLN